MVGFPFLAQFLCVTPWHAVQATASRKPVKDAVTVVTTAEAFVAAVKRGDAHIEVQEHLHMPEISWAAVKPNLGDIPFSVLSITVCCVIISYVLQLAYFF